MPARRAPSSTNPASGVKPPSPLPPWTIRHNDANLHGIGDRAILQHRCLGLICSVQCPGSVVIKTFDAIRELRDAGVVVAGGFHSPMEKECLEFILRGSQPVIICPAKGLSHPRIPDSWRPAIDAGRMLIASPFEPESKRTNEANAQLRNEFVAALATAALVPYASPGGKAEAIARSLLERGRPIFTFDDEANSELLQSGAQRFSTSKVLAAIQNSASNSNWRASP